MGAQTFNIFLFAVKCTNLILPEVIFPWWKYLSVFVKKNSKSWFKLCYYVQNTEALIYFHILFKNSHTLGLELLTVFSRAGCKYSVRVAVVYWSRVGAFYHRKKGLFKNKVISLLVKDCEKRNKKDPKKIFLWLLRYSLLDGMFSDSSNQSSDWINPPPKKRVIHACTNIHRRGLQRQIWWRHRAVGSGPILIINQPTEIKIRLVLTTAHRGRKKKNMTWFLFDVGPWNVAFLLDTADPV